MSEENGMQATTPAAHEATTTPAEQHTPAEHQEHYHEPAHEETPADYDEPEHEQHHEHDGDEGDQPKRKKASGAQRAKAQREYFQNELSAREQRIAQLEAFINERDQNDRQTESERHAEAQRKKDEAHLERIRASKTTIRDFDRVLRSMDGVPIHMDLVEDIKASDKSELLTYHLANNPKKLNELNNMSDRERARELGRLEATLKIPEGRKQTKAPPPPSNLKGGAAPHANPNTGPDDMNNFATWLKRDLAKRSGRGEKR